MSTTMSAAVPTDSTTALTDHELVGQYRAGDREAFAVLVRRHLPGVRRTAYGYARWWSLAEDVIRETFVIAARDIDQFGPGHGSFCGWVRAIAKHGALVSMGLPAPRWGGRPAVLDAFEFVDGVIASTAPQTPAALLGELLAAAGVRQGAPSDERAERIRRAVAQVDGLPGAAVRLFLLGHSFADIGDALGVPEACAAKVYAKGVRSIVVELRAPGRRPRGRPLGRRIPPRPAWLTATASNGRIFRPLPDGGAVVDDFKSSEVIS